jgi:hypothetical protein
MLINNLAAIREAREIAGVDTITYDVRLVGDPIRFASAVNSYPAAGDSPFRALSSAR